MYDVKLKNSYFKAQKDYQQYLMAILDIPPKELSLKKEWKKKAGKKQ